MKVDELTKNQLAQLKANYLTQLDGSGELEEKTGLTELSYGVLVSVDDYVSDDFILEYYAGVEFSEDDFADEDKSEDESNDNEDEW